MECWPHTPDDQQTAEVLGRRLLEIIVYDRCCRISGMLMLTVDDLALTSEAGDWKVPDFWMACTYAVSQGWLIVSDDVVTLTTAFLRASDHRPSSRAQEGETVYPLD